VREFRGLVFAQFTSELGDQIARVAIALLVLERTGSAFGAAVALALTYIPAFFGAALLGPLADRRPRRTLMLGADAGRFVLLLILGALATSTSPLLLLFLLLLVAEFLTPVFESARTAAVPTILGDAAWVTAGTGLMRTLSLVSQVVGLVAGGLAVTLISSRAALLLDAFSFLVSLAILAVVLERRAAPLPGPTTVAGFASDLRIGWSVLWADRSRRALVLLAWGMVLTIVAPEALGLPYARSVGLQDYWGGILMASMIGGAAVGSILIARITPLRQVELLLPLALVCNLPLLLTGIQPPVVVLALLWFIGGMAQAFFVTIMAFTTLLTVDTQRGRVAGLAAAGFAVAALIGMLAAGVLADRTSPAFAVTVFACLGLVIVTLAVRSWPGVELRHDVGELEHARP
jgi:MFS family permease